MCHTLQTIRQRRVDHREWKSNIIEGYIERHRISGRRFGEAALSDPGFVASLARGRSLRLDTADRLLVFMGEAPIGPAFRREVEAFLSVTRTKAYLLGLDAAGDPSFVARLRKGVSPRLPTVDRVRAWMDEACTDEQRRAIHAAMATRPLNGLPVIRRRLRIGRACVNGDTPLFNPSDGSSD